MEQTTDKDELYEFFENHARRIGISEEEFKKIIYDILKGTNVEEEILNLIGYDYIDDASVIIKNKDFILSLYDSNNNVNIFCEEESDFTNDKLSNEKQKRKTILENDFWVEYNLPVATKNVERKIINKNQLKESDRCYFKYERFNPVQSAVFETAYKTQKNLIVSAPTGCGKTDIALLCILNSLNLAGKIVMIVPMRALAHEIAMKYSLVFKNKHKVLEYTGDTEVDHQELEKTKILIATPEKFDFSTRKLHNGMIISLLIIDEIHLLAEDRGAVLEAIVARIFRQIEITQNNIRIVGLSATLPNSDDVGRFVRAEKIFCFGPEYRPVPLEISIIGIKKSKNNRLEETSKDNLQISEFLNHFDPNAEYSLSDIFKAKNKNIDTEEIIYKSQAEGEQKSDNFYKESETTNMIIEDKLSIMFKGGHQVIIFVGSRRETHKTANFFQGVFLDKKFGVHHAGLLRKERLLTESNFKKGKIDCLISTSTLAWGVNLPAHCVIIKNTQYYNQESGKFEDMSVLDILQIFGRAGRPQYDVLGKAFLITKIMSLHKYSGILSMKKNIESKLMHRFVDILNSEIYLGTITNLKEAIMWFQTTFMYIRMKRDPIIYGLNHDEIKNKEFNKVIVEYIALGLRRLNECGLITFQIANKQELQYNFDDWYQVCGTNNTYDPFKDFKGVYTSTFYGRIASHFYIYHESIDLWKKECRSIFDLDSLLELVFRSKEFQQIIVRDDEASVLKAHHDDLGLDFVENTVSKLRCLFKLYERKIPTYSSSLHCDQLYMIKNLERMTPAILEIVLHENLFEIYSICEYLYKLVSPKKVENNISGDVTQVYLGEYSLFYSNNQNQIKIENNGALVSVLKKNVSFVSHKPSDHLYSKDINIKSKYLTEIETLYKFGLHFCEETKWSFSSHKKSCKHFEILDEFDIFEKNQEDTILFTNDYDLISKHKNILIIPKNTEKILVKIHIKQLYDIDFYEVDSVSEKEKQLLIMKNIIKLIKDYQNYIIIVKNKDEATNTISGITLSIALDEDLNKNYESEFHKKSSGKNIIQVLTFNEAKKLKFTKENTVFIFKGLQSFEPYPLIEILTVIKGKKCKIFEIKDFIDFYRHVMRNNSNK